MPNNEPFIVKTGQLQKKNYEPFFPDQEIIENNPRKESGKDRFSLDKVTAHIPDMNPVYQSQ
jgi:hypothetical protein